MPLAISSVFPRNASPVSRLVLSRGSVGKIECDAPDESDKKTCDKYGGKAYWCNVAVVQEGQENGGYHCESEAQHVPLQIDRFARLTLHVRRVPSGMSSTVLYCSLEGGASTSIETVMLRLIAECIDVVSITGLEAD